MGLRVSVDVEGPGQVVVRQVADGDDVARLERRAAGLTAAAGAGVVPILRSGPTGDGAFELVTAHAGLPVDAARVDGPVGLADVGARVAAALARLHDAGLVHGRLEVEHVLVGHDGDPRLCGIDPSNAAPADDVAALGRLLGLVAGDLSATDARLDTILASAVDPDAERRPTARRLAADLGAIVGPAVLSSRRLPPTRPVALISAALAVAVALVVGLAARRPTASPGRASTASIAPSTSVATSTTAAPPPECVATAERPIQPGDGCPYSVAIDGGIVEIDGRRVVVGRAGDEVVVGDWGCEGAARPAVLRPATGEVLVYGGLAPGATPEVVQAERVDGATGLRARRGRDGCAELLVVTEDGAIRLT